MKHYFQDVRTLSDAELKQLSEELDDAYRANGYEEDYWTDDEAEKRYYELTGEIRRREDERDPEAAARRRQLFGPMMGRMSALMAAMLPVFYEKHADLKFIEGEKWGKIGDTITIKRPSKFIGPGQDFSEVFQPKTTVEFVPDPLFIKALGEMVDGEMVDDGENPPTDKP